MKEFLKIAIPIYRAELKVFFGTTEECAEAMRLDGRPEHKIAEWKENADKYNGMYHHDGDYRVAWFKNWPKSVDDYGNMVHEIEHATFYILQSRGLKHTEESDEAYSYLMGFLFSEIDAYIATEADKNLP